MPFSIACRPGLCIIENHLGCFKYCSGTRELIYTSKRGRAATPNLVLIALSSQSIIFGFSHFSTKEKRQKCKVNHYYYYYSNEYENDTMLCVYCTCIYIVYVCMF